MIESAQWIARAGPSKHQEPVARGVDPAAAMPLELATDRPMVPSTRSRHRRSPISAARSVDPTMSVNRTVARTLFEFWHRWLDSHETPDLIHHRREHLR